MKNRKLALSVVATFLAVLAASTWLAAQEENPKRSRYIVTDLGTLNDGPFSLAVGLNNKDWINGASGVADGSQHAVLWEKGVITDIATEGLGGPNSEAYGVNEWGQAAGLAETSNSDPNGEDFCGYGTHLICLAFLWQNGVMTPLPTLGGNNGEAGQVNNRGDVAGNAENTTIDSTCPSPQVQVLEEKPVIWKNGQIEELDTFHGDPDGWAFGINDRGQVVGASGICSTLNQDTGVYILSRHALMWERGKLTDLGNLGGSGAFGPGNIAGELNNQGQVVGTSDLKGDTNFHAFLWTRETGMKDLGTLPADVDSAGLGINDRGEVVGVSFDGSGNPRAFLRRDGEKMTDLNTLIPSNSPLYLLFAHGINSRGEITGFGVNSAGDIHAFLAKPCRWTLADTDCCKEDREGTAARVDDSVERPRVVLSENAREVLKRQLPFGRFGGRLMGPE